MLKYVIFLDDDIHLIQDILVDITPEFPEEIELKFFKRVSECYSFIMNNAEKTLIVFVDMNMPECDGISFIEGLHKKYKTIPGVIITGLLPEKNDMIKKNEDILDIIPKDACIDEKILKIIKEALPQN